MSELSKKWDQLGDELKKTIEYKIESICFDISIQIYNQMRRLNLSKKDLAERLKVSKSYVTQLLKGKTNITIETLIKIADALNLISKIDLMPLEEEKRFAIMTTSTAFSIDIIPIKPQESAKKYEDAVNTNVLYSVAS